MDRPRPRRGDDHRRGLRCRASLDCGLLEPPHSFALVPALVCLLVLVLAMLVRFDTPFGFTVRDATRVRALAVRVPLAHRPDRRRRWRWRSRGCRTSGPASCRPAGSCRSRATPGSRSGRWPCSRSRTWTRATPAPALLLAALARSSSPTSPCRPCASRCSGAPALPRGAALDLGLRDRRRTVGRRARGRRGRSTPARSPRSRSCPLLGLLAVFAHERHQRLAEHARALERVPRHRARARRRHRSRRRLHRRALQERRRPRARPRRRTSASAPSASATSSSPRCCTTSARSPSPRRSSTSPASSTPTSGRSSRPTRSRARRCSNASAGSCARSGMIVRSHHERWDGAGYPDGLAGEQIPLEARIITCCDTWNAMRTDRPYREALSVRRRARGAALHRRHAVRPGRGGRVRGLRGQGRRRSRGGPSVARYCRGGAPPAPWHLAPRSVAALARPGGADRPAPLELLADARPPAAALADASRHRRRAPRHRIDPRRAECNLCYLYLMIFWIRANRTKHRFAV